jgi:hypothetical protein
MGQLSHYKIPKNDSVSWWRLGSCWLEERNILVARYMDSYFQERRIIASQYHSKYRLLNYFYR